MLCYIMHTTITEFAFALKLYIAVWPESEASHWDNCLHICLAKVEDITWVGQVGSYEAKAISRQFSEFHVSWLQRAGVLQHLLLQLFLGLEQGFDFRVDAPHTKPHHLLSPAYIYKLIDYIYRKDIESKSVYYFVDCIKNKKHI